MLRRCGEDWAKSRRGSRHDRSSVSSHPTARQIAMMPVLSAAEILRLRRIPKPLEPAWIDHLVARLKVDGKNRVARLDLLKLDNGPTRGTMVIYARESIRDVSNYSVGLAFTDLADNEYRFVRCNGPSHEHTNRWPRGAKLGVTPHIHYLTETYQHRAIARPGQVKADGFAVASPGQFVDVRTALVVLGRRISIETQGSLLGGCCCSRGIHVSRMILG